MSREELRESELERELDSLYRKVAGLDQPADDRKKPDKTRSGQRRRRFRFRTVGLGWGLAITLSLLGMLGFLWWQEGDREGGYAIQIRAYPEDQKQRAQLFLDDVRKRTSAVSMETVTVAGSGVWHRILLGNFSTAEQAADYQKSDRVAREYPYGFIQRTYGNGLLSISARRSAAGEPPP